MSKIVIAPDKTLNTICKEVEIADVSLPNLIKDMKEEMYDNFGVGIAAPQLGILKRVVVIDVDYDIKNSSTRDPLVLINPKIVKVYGEEITEDEGCLSCPGISVPVTRKNNVKVEFQDESGDDWEIEGEGLLARCLQHEIDHLNGITLFESCDREVRLKAIAAYNEAKIQGLKPGNSSIQVR